MSIVNENVDVTIREVLEQVCEMADITGCAAALGRPVEAETEEQEAQQEQDAKEDLRRACEAFSFTHRAIR